MIEALLTDEQKELRDENAKLIKVLGMHDHGSMLDPHYCPMCKALEVSDE